MNSKVVIGFKIFLLFTFFKDTLFPSSIVKWGVLGHFHFLKTQKNTKTLNQKYTIYSKNNNKLYTI